MLRSYALFVAVISPMSCASPPTGDRAQGLPTIDVEALLQADEDAFGEILAEADALRLKVEVALVIPGPGGPTLLRDSVDYGPQYFYPASSVKTCAVIAALQRLDGLEQETGAGIDRRTAMRFFPLFDGEEVEDVDPANLGDGTFTVEHDARKVLLVSDNAGYNRLYEFAGPDRINGAMAAAGLERTRIVHRLSEFHSPEEQLRVPRLELYREGRVLAVQPERSAPSQGSNAGLSGLVFGRAHEAGAGRREGPMSFEFKNFMALGDLLEMNVMLLRPDVRLPGRAAGAGFELSEQDRSFVREVMASTPGVSEDPVYDAEDYPDEYSKFLAPGVWRVRRPDQVTVRDKIGRAYGFSVTNSEIVDEVSGKTLFVAATLYTNPNDVVGDGVYDYDRADRFFADLGEALTRALLTP